ncbi:hypothetical protein ACFWYW_39310 [Nonomuraea sp. NPDC059023]|uniref:hypothetical protein n=1 Tax=unclassified Nonomuraea TaxID=2593643 RepID=UPI0036BDF85D
MVYRHVDLLRHDRAVLDADALTAMTPDDHRRTFATAMAVLVTNSTPTSTARMPTR